MIQRTDHKSGPLSIFNINLDCGKQRYLRIASGHNVPVCRSDEILTPETRSFKIFNIGSDLIVAKQATGPAWYLSEQRKTVDRIDQYKYSDLILVLSKLMRDGRLMESDLAGLRQKKIAEIKLGTTL